MEHFNWVKFKSYQMYFLGIKNMDFNAVITGITAGMVSTIGSWLIQRYFLKKWEKIEDKLVKKIKDKNGISD